MLRDSTRTPHRAHSSTSLLRRVVDLNCVRVQAGNLRQILGVQNRAVLAVARLMRQRDETGVAVRDVHDRAGQRQRLDDVVGVLDGTDVHWRDAGQHLAGEVRLHRQRNVAQVQVAAVRVRIEEGQVDAFVSTRIMGVVLDLSTYIRSVQYFQMSDFWFE